MVRVAIEPGQILRSTLSVAMPDGTEWMVPVREIVRLHALRFSRGLVWDVVKTFTEYTLPLFCVIPERIAEWASQNVKWAGIARYARCGGTLSTTDAQGYQRGWKRGDMTIYIPAPFESVIDITPSTEKHMAHMEVTLAFRFRIGQMVRPPKGAKDRPIIARTADVTELEIDGRYSRMTSYKYKLAGKDWWYLEEELSESSESDTPKQEPHP